jgi:S-adenosylmethionine:tRNA-ribosyltransferase-isomerase (queuine synthetase)
LITDKFEKDFNELLDYCKKSGIQIINDYHVTNLRSMLRRFPKEEIEIAIDIARAHGCLKNWVKYTAGILWRREKEGK